MRPRIREAFVGLGWYLGPAVMLLVVDVLILLLMLSVDMGSMAPDRLSFADWALTATLASVAVGVVVAGFIHRRLVRTPRIEDFGFGWGIDPEFIERRRRARILAPAPATRPAAKT